MLNNLINRGEQAWARAGSPSLSHNRQNCTAPGPPLARSAFNFKNREVPDARMRSLRRGACLLHACMSALCQSLPIVSPSQQQNSLRRIMRTSKLL
jgi:hypothetical protein